MTHEPECLLVADHILGIDFTCQMCAALRIAYRRGFNDHARSVQHWQDTHGAYRQHGQGENP